METHLFNVKNTKRLVKFSIYSLDNGNWYGRTTEQETEMSVSPSSKRKSTALHGSIGEYRTEELKSKEAVYQDIIKHLTKKHKDFKKENIEETRSI